ncbi:MAG: DNA replication and repair protein RecF [Spirochaetaceae bacterium]|nr:DNA replication and repair protein RecF [Spirochaetaceae bacterium]
MIFHSLWTASFRNLADAESYTGEKDIFLVGENGQGKTNFLEALYFAAYGSSFRGVRDGEIARNGEKNFAVRAKIVSDYGKNAASYPVELHIKSEKGKKNFFLDGKRIEERRNLLSVVPCIVFCHEDMEFVSGSPERRRWFFDQSLSLCDVLYLDDLRNYRQVLKSRNALLREAVLGRRPAPEVLDALDLQLVVYGLKLVERREREAALFSELFGPLFREVSDIPGITVRYNPSWKFCELGEGVAFLAGRREADLSAGLSLSGPHRDRYAFYRESEEFAAQASTGQRRLLALLLRIAQARRFSESTGKRPVLLLDDVLLEMDGEKRRRFLSVMPVYDQAFYTFLPEEPYRRYVRGGDVLVYAVESGVLRPQGEDV